MLRGTALPCYLNTFWASLDPSADGQRAGASTHSHEGDYFIHVRADVALHEGHQHSQLLEQKLEQTRKSSTSWYQKDAELTGLLRDGKRQLQGWVPQHPSY